MLKAVRERLATYLPEDDLAGAMKMLEERGWDATETVYSQRATDGKRDWGKITGQRYGVRVAADWRPDGWLADFDHLTVQQAEETVTTARDGLNALHRVQAVSESDAERANGAEKIIPVLVKRMEELEAQRRGKAGELAAIPNESVANVIRRLDGEINAKPISRKPVFATPMPALQWRVGHIRRQDRGTGIAGGFARSHTGTGRRTGCVI